MTFNPTRRGFLKGLVAACTVAAAVYAPTLKLARGEVLTDPVLTPKPKVKAAEPEVIKRTNAFVHYANRSCTVYFGGSDKSRSFVLKGGGQPTIEGTIATPKYGPTEVTGWTEIGEKVKWLV